MLRLSRFVLALTVAVTAFALVPTAHAAEPKRVTRVVIKKNDHTMTLLSTDKNGNEETVATYTVAIGPGGSGFKRKEGDMVTPVGRYHVTMHQPSQYKWFLRLDYPNAQDRARFASLKKKGDLPASANIGGDIGIHGPPISYPKEMAADLKKHDWTAGCIAVDSDEILEVARLVKDGTPIDIED